MNIELCMAIWIIYIQHIYVYIYMYEIDLDITHAARWVTIHSAGLRDLLFPAPDAD